MHRRAPHEHDAVGLWPLQAEADVRLGSSLERAGRVGRGGARGFEHRVEDRELAVTDREQQVRLVGEVQVDRRRRHPDRVGDRADRDGVLVAGLHEQQLGRDEDLLAKQLAVTPAGAGSGSHRAPLGSTTSAVASPASGVGGVGGSDSGMPIFS